MRVSTPSPVHPGRLFFGGVYRAYEGRKYAISRLIFWKFFWGHSPYWGGATASLPRPHPPRRSCASRSGPSVPPSSSPPNISLALPQIQICHYTPGRTVKRDWFLADFSMDERGTGRSAPQSIRPKCSRSAPSSGTFRPRSWVILPQHPISSGGTKVGPSAVGVQLPWPGKNGVTVHIFIPSVTKSHVITWLSAFPRDDAIWPQVIWMWHLLNPSHGVCQQWVALL